MVRHTKWIIALTFVTALAAIAASAFSGLQWWEAHTGGELVKKQVQAAQTLADAAKKQVDIAGRLLGISQNQATATQMEAHAASEQAETGKQLLGVEGQTSQVQSKVADMTANAIKPRVIMSEARVDGFSGTPDKDGQVEITYWPEFTNTGGATLYSTGTTVALFVGQALPPIPSYATADRFGGNDLATKQGEAFNAEKAFTTKVDSETAKLVYSNEYKVFIYGIASFTDAEKTPYSFCYAYEVTMNKGGGSRVTSSGSPAYHCSK